MRFTKLNILSTTQQLQCVFVTIIETESWDGYKQKLHREMAIKSMKLSIKFRALSKAYTTREQTVFYNAKCLSKDVPKALYHRSVDKNDLKNYISTQYKTSRIILAACVMCDKVINNVQKRWARICTSESEVERAKHLLKANLLLDSKLYWSFSYSYQQASISIPVN